MEPLLEQAVTEVVSERRDHDPKSLLQEWVQSQGYGPPYYHTLDARGPEHEKEFEVEVLVNGESVARGIGHSKQLATKAAARAALKAMGLE